MFSGELTERRGGIYMVFPGELTERRGGENEERAARSWVTGKLRMTESSDFINVLIPLSHSRVLAHYIFTLPSWEGEWRI